DGGQRPAAGDGRMRGDQHEHDHTGFATAVDPVVNRAALDDHVAGFEVHLIAVEIHVDLARQDDRVVDRVSAVVPSGIARGEFDDAKHGAIGVGGAGLPL